MKTRTFIAALTIAFSLCGCEPKPDPTEQPARTGPISWTPFRGETGKWGFKDSSGSTTLEAKFDGVMPFSDDRARVRVNGKYGFIDPSGKLAVPAIYDNAHSFSDSRAVVNLGEKYGYVDTSGKVAIEIKLEYADRFADGFATVTLDGKVGYVDVSGKFTEGAHPTASKYEL